MDSWPYALVCTVALLLIALIVAIASFVRSSRKKRASAAADTMLNMEPYLHSAAAPDAVPVAEVPGTPVPDTGGVPEAAGEAGWLAASPSAASALSTPAGSAVESVGETPPVPPEAEPATSGSPPPESAHGQSPVAPPDATSAVTPRHARDDIAEYVMVAPVEMQLGEDWVGVKAGTKTHEQFRRYADALLKDCRAARDSTP